MRKSRCRRFACPDDSPRRQITYRENENLKSMNLYRNFGNLFESWVTESSLDLHSQAVTCVDRSDIPGSDSLSRDTVPPSHIKSESEDSGFETASLIRPCHSHQEAHLSHPGNGFEEDDVPPSSPATSVRSSSSSCVSLGSVAQRNTYLTVDQALTRAEITSGHVTKQEPLYQTESRPSGPRHRCNTASFPTSCHTGTSSRVHGRPRRTHSQPSDHKKAEVYRRLLKSHQYGQPVASQLEFEEGEQRRLDKLSPGLLYLEQVCRMLENMAKLQQQNNSLQKDIEILRSQHAETECAHLKENEINYPAKKRWEIQTHEVLTSVSNLPKEPAVFQQRSVSDTWATVGRHRRARFAQHESCAGVLCEEPDSKETSPQALEGERKKTTKIQKLEVASLRRTKTLNPETKSQSKKTKLANIFRRRMTTRL